MSQHSDIRLGSFTWKYAEQYGRLRTLSTQ